MPKATAVWLIDNTTLTFDQIADFCSIHVAEVKAIADGQSSIGLRGVDPIVLGQLTIDEIKRCESDPDAKLTLNINPELENNKFVKKYTPIKKRKNRLHAILWFIENYSEISDNKICKLLSTTKKTIESIRNKTHKDFEQLKPRSPVQLELCSEEELNAFIGQNQQEQDKVM